ncbi:hypothetical protein Ntsu_29290 [Nocardia sp. IFM 10818]
MADSSNPGQFGNREDTVEQARKGGRASTGSCSMRRAVEIAEALAPTRPHAGVESVGANLLVGPFAAMLDRARDAISTPRS